LSGASEEHKPAEKRNYFLPFYLFCFSSAGHFAKDCFMQPGGTKYSLIPDEEEEKEEAKAAEFEKPDPTRNSSRKRKKVSAVLVLFIIFF
jgi:hypothetical protein